MKDRIVREPHVWDLHIHTPLGTPTKKNYENCSSEDFVDGLIAIYKEAEKDGYPIHMISFTDHNQINVEVYDIFRKKSNIAIIPGIEMDIFLNADDKNSKHVIFYFSEDELEKLHDLNDIIQEYIKSSNKVIFESFVMELIHHKKQFAVSPHAFKQGKRGIDYEWSDDASAQKGVNKFSGLFFPFWEAAGTSDVVKAIEFLKQQSSEEEEDHAVIAFSDSADWNKIKKYVTNPHQYFLCLNSFKGLLLAGSDKTRIIDQRENRPDANPSEKIRSIQIRTNISDIKSEKESIEFSDRLTAIIGGRGKGKSALLDAMVYAVNPELIEDSNRTKFVKKFDVELENFVGAGLVSDLNIQYFSQSYINKLFSGNSTSQNLYGYFKSYFDRMGQLSASVADVEKYLEELRGLRSKSIDDGNIVDSIKQLILIQNDKIYPEIKRKVSKAIPFISGQGRNKSSYADVIKQILPKDKELWESESLQNKFSEFIRQLVWEIAYRNYQEKLEKSYANLLRKQIEQVKKAQSKQAKEKAQSREKLENKLRVIYSREMEKVKQINELYTVPIAMTDFQMEFLEHPGEGGNKFYFVTYVNREHPVEYARRVICESIDKRSWKNPQDSSNEELFRRYAFNDGFNTILIGQRDTNDVKNIIDDVALSKHKLEHKIIYSTTDGVIDLHETSPGTQTNAIMELMLHTDSSAPMFLDQPEDNIDNEARYEKLTKWIKSQKYRRQIILVTHDANIVINGDAEGVIIADHDENCFKYTYGALEYEDILDRASVILDGGKSAIKKRIEKYGE